MHPSKRSANGWNWTTSGGSSTLTRSLIQSSRGRARLSRWCTRAGRSYARTSLSAAEKSPSNIQSSNCPACRRSSNAIWTSRSLTTLLSIALHARRVAVADSWNSIRSSPVVCAPSRERCFNRPYRAPSYPLRKSDCRVSIYTQIYYSTLI